jgi:hypothetical protein
MIAELILMDGATAARIVCDPGLIPAPGRYLLARDDDGSSWLAEELFAVRAVADGFIAEAPAPRAWRPGTRLVLRGPLGHGFTLPPAARRVALVAWDGTPRRLLALIDAALQQDASVARVCGDPPVDLPLQVEVQPIGELGPVCAWSDYAAFDVQRESLKSLQPKLASRSQLHLGGEAEILVRVRMPCGGIAECGVCNVKVGRRQRLACVDGPVFDLKLLISES